jgi:hypothetical protein
MDDFLLKGALYLGVAVGLALIGLEAASSEGSLELSAGAWALVGAIAVAPVGMGLTGLRIRRREERALALFTLIDRDVEISARDLVRDSDWTPALLDRAIRDLNNVGAAYVVWDRDSQLIQDGRLRRSSMLVDDCGSCGAKISLQVPIGEASAVRCPYCDAAIDAGVIAEEKARIIDELEEDRSKGSERDPWGAIGGEFSIGIFFLLFLCFWPAALLYCVKHRRVLEQLVR